MTATRIESEEPLGMVSLSSGETRVVFTSPEIDVRAGAREPAPEASSGVIYTDRADMPSLEELLRQHEIAYAVLERPAPEAATEGTRAPAALTVERPLIGPVRIFVASAVATAVGAVGWTLLADSLASDAVNANPYTALSLGLGGIVLIVTLIVALRSGPPGRHG